MDLGIDTIVPSQFVGFPVIKPTDCFGVQVIAKLDETPKICGEVLIIFCLAYFGNLKVNDEIPANVHPHKLTTNGA